MNSQRQEVQTRLRALEIVAYWEGRLITNQLTDWFGISRQQASADIKLYNSEVNPGSLEHHPAVKGYVPIGKFTPVLSAGHINEYMELLSSQSCQPMAQVLESHSNIAAVQLPDRAVRPEIVRELVKACRNRESLHIVYSSMNTPQLHERIISPHTLVYTGFRWHVRAYCHMRKEFRDFLVSRIDRARRAPGSEVVSDTLDLLWLEDTTLTLVPNRNLSEAQRSLVERDYGIADGRLRIKVKKALAHYTLQRYQAAISEEQIERFKEHPLQLLPSDLPQVKSYLFGTEAE